MNTFNPQFEKIGQILLHLDLVNEEELKQALEEQKLSNERLGEVLIKKGIIGEKQFIKALSEQLGHRMVDEEELMKAPKDVVKLIPSDFAQENRVLALATSDNTVVVAMEDPEDLVTLDNIKKLTEMNPEVVIAGPSALQKAIDRIYGELKTSGQVEEAISGITIVAGEEDDAEEVDLSEENVSEEDAPIVRLVNLILQEAIKERATDVHVEPQSDSVLVRIRTDGVLRQIMTPPISSLSGLTTRIKILAGLNIAERRLPQDGRFTIKAKNREIDVRTSILPTIHGEKVVMRLLDKGDFQMDLTTLGFDDNDLKIFRHWIQQPYGMVIISGPTGSGKSTTLYAALKQIKSEGINITTAEDPVEYQLGGINQIQVKEDIGLTFGSVLRSVLRQDPDVLLIGEIRDRETADIAVKFSLTGHLVFSTVHANDAPSTITRLIDIGVPPFLAGSCLNLIMAQRLVRTICPNCKEEYTPTQQELSRIAISEEQLQATTFYKGRGCVNCRQTGYYGRTGIFEILEVKQPVRRMIFDEANEEELKERANEDGMVSLRQAGINKVLKGVTTIDEVLRSTVEEI